MLRTPSRIRTGIFLRKSSVSNIQKIFGKNLRKFRKCGPWRWRWGCTKQ